ncbi:MAG: hypothetical protein ACOC3W_11320 [Thermodesulfobacteriota bacterium]
MMIPLAGVRQGYQPARGGFCFRPAETDPERRLDLDGRAPGFRKNRGSGPILPKRLNIQVLAARKPRLLFRSFGLFLLRLDRATLSRSLFQEPPRSIFGTVPLKGHPSQDSFPQMPGVGMGGMADPTLDSLLDFVQ